MKARVAVLLCFGLLSCSVKIPARPELVEQSSVVFTPAHIEDWVEPNGLQVLLLQDSSLPLIHGDLYIRAASLSEPAQYAGLTEALFNQVRAGGVHGMTPAEVDEQLDSVGASIEGEAGREFSSISFFSHSGDFSDVISLLSKMVQEPSFDENRLRLWKAQVSDSIARRKESAELIAAQTFNAALYAPESPYSRLISLKSLSRIERSVLIRAAESLLKPKGALLAVSGDISRQALHELLGRFFSGWLGKSDQIIPPRVYRNRPGIYLVESSFPQAEVIIGQEGPRRFSSDQYALSVFNRYFSRGSFGSVLFTEIRSKRGLAYSVDGGFMPETNGGQFLISMATRKAEVLNAIAEVLDQLRLVRIQSPFPARLEEIKRSVEQGFVFNFSSPEAAVTREASLRLLGYPVDYNQSYLSKISSVTEKEVLEVAERRIDLEKLVVVIVGELKAKEMSAKLNLPIYPVRFLTHPEIWRSDRVRK